MELQRDNIRAAAPIYSARQLEQLQLFAVVDRIVEQFWLGMLRVGRDEAGEALYEYYKGAPDRLTTAERVTLYARLFGAPADALPAHVKPNTAFPDLWLRFLSSLAEYNRTQGRDRQRQATTVAGEQVRQAARALAVNLSERGWGYTHFAASQLDDHVRTITEILTLRQIQAAVGAEDPWEVVERVAERETGSTPNVERYRGMARAGRRILELLAQHTQAWASDTGNPLFDEADEVADGDISFADRVALIRAAREWHSLNCEDASNGSPTL